MGGYETIVVGAGTAGSEVASLHHPHENGLRAMIVELVNVKNALCHHEGSGPPLKQNLKSGQNDIKQFTDLENWMLSINDDEIHFLGKLQLSKPIEQNLSSLYLIELLNDVQSRSLFLLG